VFKLSTPTIYSLEITPDCNNSCGACSNIFNKNKNSLSALTWQKIISHIVSHAETLKITGGEPTLHPEFKKIIETIADKNINFTLFTNACWSNPDSIINLLKSIPQCKGLLISLHGPDAGSHEAFTQTSGSFDQSCENIRLATYRGFRVHISTIITKYNFDLIREMIFLAKKLGAKCLVFNRFIGLESYNIKPDAWQVLSAINEIENLSDEFMGIQLHYGNCFPQCFMPSSSTGCWAGIAYCTIDPWGNLRPCNHSPL